MLDTHTQSAHAFSVDLDDFATHVIEASSRCPVLVDFWADWCGPCHALSPHLNRVVDERDGAITLAKLEVDEGDNMKLAGHYRVRGFPTVILFHNGIEKGRFSGARSTHWLREWIQDQLE